MCFIFTCSNCKKAFTVSSSVLVLIETGVVIYIYCFKVEAYLYEYIIPLNRMNQKKELYTMIFHEKEEEERTYTRRFLSLLFHVFSRLFFFQYNYLNGG